MKGRKSAIPHEEVINTVLQFKDRIVRIDEHGEKKIVVATDDVWNDVSVRLNSLMTKSAIHTFVAKGRHNIKEQLGFTPRFKPISTNVINCSPSDKSSSDENSSIDDVYQKKMFVVTFSVEEWNKIKPQQVLYRFNDPNRPSKSCKTYYMLTKNQWSPIIAEHFWLHTQLPCCLAFKKANVHPQGSNFITVVARCSICSSHFKGIIAEQPLNDERVLMQCTYIGNFDSLHQSNKKRRLIGPAKDEVITSIIDRNISCETYREKEATRLMRTGTHEPAILPTSNCLRTLKSKHLLNNQRHKEVFTSLALMKTENEYKNIIHDIGYDPFFVHYHCAEQIHTYRSYCRTTDNPRLVIDATGSVVKKFHKLGLDQTNNLFLYEALVYDDHKSFTATNMISERHSNIAISNWLMKWISTDVRKPKETVCDNSLALLSAIVKSFTQYSSVQDYVKICADLLNNEIMSTSHLVPQCFVRIDVAHFIKICCKWKPLMSVPPRVKEIILRCVGLLIKSQYISEVRSLLLSMFVVFINETDGIDLQTGRDTPCEIHKKKLIEATSCGFIEFEHFINSNDEIDNEAKSLLEDVYEKQNEGLYNFENPFQTWADDIYNTSKNLVQEGSTINPLFLPSIIPFLTKIMKLLPLWSGVMVPIFGYGNETSSSSAVESSFRKLKMVTFKHITLPTNLEIFLENHIQSLKGSALIRSTINNNIPSSPEIKELSTVKNKIVNLTSSLNFIEENGNSKPICVKNNVETEQDNDSNGNLLPSLTFIEDNPLSPSALYILEGDNNFPINDEENDVSSSLECIDILKDENSLDPINDHNVENKARENWNRKNRQRKSNSYLLPNPHLRHLNIVGSKNKRSLPILKNGSRFEELKSTLCKSRPGKLILSNTCAFDSLASLIMVTYCDNQNYAAHLNSSHKSVFLNFIEDMIKNGISSSTYSKRADIIINSLNPQQQQMEYGNLLVSCDTTLGHLLNAILNDVPSATEIIKCSSQLCILNNSKSERLVMYLTFQMDKEGELNTIQAFLDQRTKNEYTTCTLCDSMKTIETKISKLHIFIDVLYWEGENNNYSSDAAHIAMTRLCNIPSVLINEAVAYELRGVISFRPGKSQLRNSIGHYVTYAKRGTKNWEMYDDLKNKSVPVKDTKVVPCEFLLYTI